MAERADARVVGCTKNNSVLEQFNCHGYAPQIYCKYLRIYSTLYDQASVAGR
jgi:hypothetical protein